VRRVLAVVAIARAAQFIEAVLFPLVAVHHGAGTAGAAVVLLALAVGTTAGSLLGGSTIDRLGTRIAASSGLALAAAGAATLSIVEQTVPLAGAAALYGMATATWRLALEAATAHGLAAGRAGDEGGDQALREHAFGAFVWLVNAGALASAIVLATGLDLRTAVLAQAISTAIAAVAAAALVPARAFAAPRSAPTTRGLAAVPARVWLLALAFAPFTVVMFQAFAGLAEIFDDADYRLMVLVNAATLVAFPLVLWRAVARVPGAVALGAAGALQGGGIAAAALLRDPLVTTLAWSAGEATLISLMPAVVTGIAPHAATGRYRAAFAAVQGAAAAVATFAGPLLAARSVAAFAAAVILLTVVGVVAVARRAASVAAGLSHPVACPCGALSCSCDAQHIACALPSSVLVHAARAGARA